MVGLDYRYVTTWSLAYDVKLMFMTFAVPGSLRTARIEAPALSQRDAQRSVHTVRWSLRALARASVCNRVSRRRFAARRALYGILIAGLDDDRASPALTRSTTPARERDPGGITAVDLSDTTS